MANKTIPEENIREEDIIGEVKITVDRDAFKPPKLCHGKKLNRVYKKTKIKNIDFDYYALKCYKCKREYLDDSQSRKLEAIWSLQKILDNKTIEIERNINFDGKAYFLRFPNEITKKWHKGLTADIKVLNTSEFLIKVKI